MLRVFCALIALAWAIVFAGLPDAQAQPGVQPRTQTPADTVTQAEPLSPSSPAAAEPGSAPTPAPAPPPRAAESQRFVLPSGPVPVQIVPSPKTEAELDAEQRDHDERVALNDQFQIYAGLLVAVGGILALAFVIQALYFAAGLRAMRRLAQAADRNVTAVQRAFVYLDKLNWRVEGSNVRITPTWVNSGATPTKSMRISTNWKASAGQLAAEFAYVYAKAPEPLFLAPHGKAEIGTVVVPMRDIEAALDERVFIYVWGRAAYEDMFEGSKPHFFEFCHRVVVTGSANAVALAFLQHGLRNATDQDRPIHEPLTE